MKKILSIFTAFTLLFGVWLFPEVSLADVQIDRGQQLSTAPVKFQVVRFGRRRSPLGAVDPQGNNGNVISSGSVVVWDGVSNDGVSINITGTSHDGMVAGIMMDTITGSSSDNTAAQDESQSNWGRMQCWGRFDEARWAGHSFPDGAGALISGSRVGTSAVPGDAGIFLFTSNDVGGIQSGSNTSRDSLGFLTENAVTTGESNIDIFVMRC